MIWYDQDCEVYGCNGRHSWVELGEDRMVQHTFAVSPEDFDAFMALLDED